MSPAHKEVADEDTRPPFLEHSAFNKSYILHA
jgi:hypothetical protein